MQVGIVCVTMIKDDDGVFNVFKKVFKDLFLHFYLQIFAVSFRHKKKKQRKRIFTRRNPLIEEQSDIVSCSIISIRLTSFFSFFFFS